jgi:hypothetical protein
MPALTTALVLGGGDTLFEDIDRYRAEHGGHYDGVVACNDAGTVWPETLDAWVSLHCRYFVQKDWRKKRAEAGYPEALRHYGHLQAFRGSLGEKAGLTRDLIATDYLFPGQDKSGSSGLFAAKVALIDLGFDRAVLCGVPMSNGPHFWDAEKKPWAPNEGFRRQWLTVPQEYRDRMTSMSGWSRVLLGAPPRADT